MSLWPFTRRVRYIPQLEVVECGAASLAMVLDFHGCSVPLVEARAACAVSRDGSSAARIVAAAEELGLEATGLKLEPSELHKLPLPAILHWEFNHFLVLERVGRRSVSLVDPARGRRTVSLADLSTSYTGVVLAFEPSERLVPRPARSRSLARYLSVLGDEKSTLLFVALAALLLELLAVLMPAATQIVIDHVLKPQREKWLFIIAAAMSAGIVLTSILEWLRNRVLVGLQTALDLTLVGDFVRHLMKLPLSFFEQRSTGDLMQRVEENSELRQLSAQLALGALDALLLLAYGSLMLAYDLRLGGLALLVSLSRLVLLQLARQSLRQGSANVLALAGRENASMVEALSAPEMMRALGAETLLFTRYGARMGDRLNAEVMLKQTNAALGAGMLVFNGAATALVLWIGGSQVIAGQMSIGVFAGFLALQALVDRPLAALFGCVDKYLYAQGILYRVDDVLETAPEPGGELVLTRLRGEVTLEALSFRHGPSSPWLFQDLSLEVRAGEKVALVGRSGQGKSTLMKLLLGVLTPAKGCILLDGVALSRLDRQALAGQLGVVLQEPFLLDDTVEANLRLRVPDASQAELETAARLACIHDVIEALPHGYRTRLGSAGLTLSGGQRQRLCLARAIVRSPGLLLLDEATSSLDLETESRLHQNLGTLGCTRILIAHRLATVIDADRILVIDGGRVVQSGRYDELLRTPGLFRELVESLS